MILKKIYQELKAQNKTLIDTSVHTDDYLEGYGSDIDLMFLGIKFATLECVTEDLTELATLVNVAFKNYGYKWDKLYETTQLDYNPIWNYDGTTTTTESRGARSETDTTGQGHGVTENKTAPHDSSVPRNVTKSENTVDARTDGHTEAAYTDTITEVRGGNQGTTTTQQMIREEREISDFNLFDVIMCDIIDLITFPYFGEE